LMKLNDRCEVLAPSLLDKIAFLDGRVSGALYTGSLVYPVFVLKHLKCMHLLEHKLPRGVSEKNALWAYTPVAYGGLGIRSLLAQSGSVSGRAITDGLGNLQKIARRYPALAPELNVKINVPMREMSYDERLRTPWSIRRQAPTLAHSKVPIYVEQALMKQDVLPGLRTLIASLRGDTQEMDANSYTHGAVVSLVANSLIYATSREAVYASIAAKILRGTSALCLIGYRRLIRCVYATEANEKAVFSTW